MVANIGRRGSLADLKNPSFFVFYVYDTLDLPGKNAEAEVENTLL